MLPVRHGSISEGDQAFLAARFAAHRDVACVKSYSCDQLRPTALGTGVLEKPRSAGPFACKQRGVTALTV